MLRWSLNNFCSFPARSLFALDLWQVLSATYNAFGTGFTIFILVGERGGPEWRVAADLACYGVEKNNCSAKKCITFLLPSSSWHLLHGRGLLVQVRIHFDFCSSPSSPSSPSSSASGADASHASAHTSKSPNSEGVATYAAPVTAGRCAACASARGESLRARGSPIADKWLHWRRGGGRRKSESVGTARLRIGLSGGWT